MEGRVDKLEATIEQLNPTKLKLLPAALISVKKRVRSIELRLDIDRPTGVEDIEELDHSTVPTFEELQQSHDRISAENAVLRRNHVAQDGGSEHGGYLGGHAPAATKGWGKGPVFVPNIGFNLQGTTYKLEFFKQDLDVGELQADGKWALDIIIEAERGLPDIDDRDRRKATQKGDFFWTTSQNADKNENTVASPHVIGLRVRELNAGLCQTYDEEKLSFSGAAALFRRQLAKNAPATGKASEDIHEALRDFSIRGGQVCFDVLKNIYSQVETQSHSVKLHIRKFALRFMKGQMIEVIAHTILNDFGLVAEFSPDSFVPDMKFGFERLTNQLHKIDWNVEKFVDSTIVACVRCNGDADKQHVARAALRVATQITQDNRVYMSGVKLVGATERTNRLIPLLLEYKLAYNTHIKTHGVGLAGVLLPESFVPHILEQRRQSPALHPTVQRLAQRLWGSASFAPCASAPSSSSPGGARHDHYAKVVEVPDEDEPVTDDCAGVQDEQALAVLPLKTNKPFAPPRKHFGQREDNKPRHAYGNNNRQQPHLKPVRNDASDKPPLRKQSDKVCRYWLKGEHCPYAPKCKFLHSKNDAQRQAVARLVK